MSNTHNTTNGSNFVLTNLEMYWVKLHPDHPAPAYGDSGERWEFVARTKIPAVRKGWLEHGLNIKTVNETNEETGETTFKFWEIRLRKPVHKRGSEEKNAPVKVMNGMLEDIDPRTIGNGSVCNAGIFKYPFEIIDPKTKKVMKKGFSFMLMRVQVTKLKLFVPKSADSDFTMVETEVITPSDEQEVDMDTASVTSVASGSPSEDGAEDYPY